MERRETRQREAILNYLRHAADHPTADMVYEAVRRAIPGISKGTVYRNLKVLEEAGRVAVLNIRGTVSRYEAKKDSHYHFRCDRCGKVIDIDEPVDAALDKRVAARTGLDIRGHQLEFRGLCPECRRQS